MIKTEIKTTVFDDLEELDITNTHYTSKTYSFPFKKAMLSTGDINNLMSESIRFDFSDRSMFLFAHRYLDHLSRKYNNPESFLAAVRKGLI